MKLTRCALTLALAAALDAAPRIHRIQLSITNPGPIARTGNVVLPVAQLARIDPGFNAANAIVVATNAANFAADARVMQAAELPSQADDLDGDGKLDELVFQIDLAAAQTRIVTIAYGDQAAIQRLRGRYPARTAMKFAARYEGLGWESEDIAWRIYFDKRNAIDIYGKRRPGLYLDVFSAPQYVYHLESPLGRDIFKVDPTLGVGSVAAIVNGKGVPVADVAERKWRVLASGPVRSIGEYEFKGWKVGGKTIDMVSRFTQWAGEHGFHHRITVSGGAAQEARHRYRYGRHGTARSRRDRHLGPSGRHPRHHGRKHRTARRRSRLGSCGTARSTGTGKNGRRQLPLPSHPAKQLGGVVRRRHVGPGKHRGPHGQRGPPRRSQ